MNPSSLSSPCIRQCCLNDNDICLGCFRSLTEIIGWTEANDDERRQILNNTTARRHDHLLKYPRAIKNAIK